MHKPPNICLLSKHLQLLNLVPRPQRKRPGIHCSCMRHYFRYISVRFTLSFDVDHIRTKYNLRTRTTQKAAAKLFCRIRLFRRVTQVFRCSLQSCTVGLCEDWRSCVCELLLMSAVSVATVYLPFLCRRSQTETEGT